MIRSESEVILSVGGSEIIDVDLCKDFDYVALGHIHASQKIKYDYVRYAGSLMKYSFDEVHQKKGMVEVTIDETGVSTQIIPLKPQKDLVKVVGKYEDVLHYPNNENDFVAVELLDKQVIGHAYDFLRENTLIYLQITYQSLEKLKTNQTASSLDVEKQSPIEIFKEFYEKMKGEAMSQESEEIIQQLLEEVSEDDAISLTLSAFGPYPDTITIDFESFQEDGLFLITGPTGSGKRMILIAMILLYIGKTSWSN